MHIHIISLFPEMFKALESGIPGRAQQRSLLKLSIINPRDFARDKHQSVDDRPYGGGPGMVMKAEPLQAAIRVAVQGSGGTTPVSCLSPQGQRFDHAAACMLSQRKQLILVAGRYEGIDERVFQTLIQEEWSIGDFVLSGGELAAMCLVDAVARLLPDVLGNAHSAQQDSFCHGLLDYPHYTRPEIVSGIAVPKVLRSGHHDAIAAWRLQQALGRTWLRRPDLLQKRVLSEQEQVLLAEFIQQQTEAGI